jgi:hypothetical protein
MPRYVKGLIAALSLALLVVAGCQRLNLEKTVEVTPTEVKIITIDGPTKEQKVNVDFTTTDAEVNVYVCLDEDKKAVEEHVVNNRTIDENKLLAKSLLKKSGTLEVTIPARKDFVVLVGSTGKKSKVTVKVVGK